MNLEEEIAAELSNQIAQEIDFELLVDVLIACGWHKVQLDSWIDRDRTVDIMNWCKANLRHKFKHRSRTFIFENQGEAVNFLLRWSK